MNNHSIKDQQLAGIHPDDMILNDEEQRIADCLIKLTDNTTYCSSNQHCVGNNSITVYQPKKHSDLLKIATASTLIKLTNSLAGFWVTEPEVLHICTIDGSVYNLRLNKRIPNVYILKIMRKGSTYGYHAVYHKAKHTLPLNARLSIEITPSKIDSFIDAKLSSEA